MAIGAGVGALLGGIAGALGNVGAQTSANRFTERTMRNRYQWQMEDMRTAGLNPILAAGAQPPSGSGAKASMDVLASTARDAMKIKAEIDLLKSQKKATDADRKYGNKFKTAATVIGKSAEVTRSSAKSPPKFMQPSRVYTKTNPRKNILRIKR